MLRNAAKQKKYTTAVDIIRQFALTGCRRNEMISLKWTEADYWRELLSVKGQRTGSLRPIGFPVVEYERRRTGDVGKRVSGGEQTRRRSPWVPRQTCHSPRTTQMSFLRRCAGHRRRRLRSEADDKLRPIYSASRDFPSRIPLANSGNKRKHVASRIRDKSIGREDPNTSRDDPRLRRSFLVSLEARWQPVWLGTLSAVDERPRPTTYGTLPSSLRMPHQDCPPGGRPCFGDRWDRHFRSVSAGLPPVRARKLFRLG
jgi:integrase